MSVNATSPIMNTNTCNCEAFNKKNTEKKPFGVCCSFARGHKYYVPVASKWPNKRKLLPNCLKRKSEM